MNATTSRTRMVYLAYTMCPSGGMNTPELVRVYSQRSYQQAYNWLADIAERYPDFGKYPMVGDGKVAVAVTNPANGQRWWLERHEVV
jgi:hypothetical protein